MARNWSIETLVSLGGIPVPLGQFHSVPTGEVPGHQGHPLPWEPRRGTADSARYPFVSIEDPFDQDDWEAGARVELWSSCPASNWSEAYTLFNAKCGKVTPRGGVVRVVWDCSAMDSRGGMLARVWLRLLVRTCRSSETTCSSRTQSPSLGPRRPSAEGSLGVLLRRIDRALEVKACNALLLKAPRRPLSSQEALETV